jgi:hypothetical protein
MTRNMMSAIAHPAKHSHKVQHILIYLNESNMFSYIEK